MQPYNPGDQRGRFYIQAHIARLRNEGFSGQQITRMVHLYFDYRGGRSDRAVVIRHLEFLKWLRDRGRLES